MCLADLDHDGDLDVVVNNLNGVAGVYRNESNAPRVAVRLKGLARNTRGIGAKIWLYGGAVPMQSQEMICGGRYLSGDDAMRVFAAGSLSNEMRIEVRWRNGKRSVVNRVKANWIYEIDEAAAAPASSKSQAPNSKETANFQLPTSNSETKPVLELSAGCLGTRIMQNPSRFSTVNRYRQGSPVSWGPGGCGRGRMGGFSFRLKLARLEQGALRRRE